MKNIVETAIDDGHFTTLVKAVQAAGLVDTLSGPGSFTVFAPSDGAFDKLPAGTSDSHYKIKTSFRRFSPITSCQESNGK